MRECAIAVDIYHCSLTETHRADIARVRLRLDEVALVARDLTVSNNTFQNYTSQQLESLSNEVGGIQTLSESHVQTQGMISRLHQAVLASTDSVGDISTDETITRTTVVRQSSSTVAPDTGQRHQSSGVELTNSIRIRTSHYWGTPCRAGCFCICHKRQQYKTPRLFDQLIGSLFVGYSGLPLTTAACNESLCQSRAVPSAQITYYFPQWFLQRALSLMLMMTPLDGPVATLRVQRAVSRE